MKRTILVSLTGALLGILAATSDVHAQKRSIDAKGPKEAKGADDTYFNIDGSRAKSAGPGSKSINSWKDQVLRAKSSNNRTNGALVIQHIAEGPSRKGLSATEIDDCRRAALEFLKSPDLNVRISGARALGSTGNKESCKPLLNALKDPDEELRYRAVTSLAALGDDSCIPGLKQQVAIDPRQMSARRAAWALMKIGTPAALRALKELRQALQNDKRNVLESRLDSMIDFLEGNGQEPQAPWDMHRRRVSVPADGLGAPSGVDGDDVGRKPVSS